MHHHQNCLPGGTGYHAVATTRRTTNIRFLPAPAISFRRELHPTHATAGTRSRWAFIPHYTLHGDTEMYHVCVGDFPEKPRSAAKPHEHKTQNHGISSRKNTYSSAAVPADDLYGTQDSLPFTHTTPSGGHSFLLPFFITNKNIPKTLFCCIQQSRCGRHQNHAYKTHLLTQLPG